MAKVSRAAAGKREEGATEISPAGLCREQVAVLEMICSGKSVKETAAAAGVARWTVYRWMRHDPAFAAAYNQWMEEMEEMKRRMGMEERKRALELESEVRKLASDVRVDRMLSGEADSLADGDRQKGRVEMGGISMPVRRRVVRMGGDGESEEVKARVDDLPHERWEREGEE